MNRNYFISILTLVILVVAGCDKQTGENPFDDPSLDPPEDTTGQTELDPTSFAGLHKNIFRPTCANSGCHDGTFEPDFRTIESSYNTLVYHEVVKNNASGDFTFRVEPFNPTGSVLIERLTNDIDGQSGIMPLATEPDSDWPTNKADYIENIRTWISNGAKDMFGNPPTQGNSEPQMQGVIGFSSGGQMLPRNPGKGALLVSAGANSLDIWVSIGDDSTSPTALSYNKIKFSTIRDDFSQSPEYSLNVVGSPQTEDGYFDLPVQYYHRYTLNNPGQYGSVGTKIYFRVYVKDPQHEVTELPETGSFNYIKEYFAIELN